MENAFILGGTGMVGRYLTKELLESPKFRTVTLITRRPLSEKELLDWPNKEKLQVQIVDFDKLEDFKSVFKDKTIGFCTLGTTRALAGSAENFVKIDHDIPLKAATLFKESLLNKPGYFQLVTAGGSNKNSFFLYPKTKGLLEQRIIRPGLLLLEGQKRPTPRFFEGLAISFVNMIGIQTGSISIAAVAKSMRKLAEEIPSHTVKIVENEEIRALSEQIY
jgi:oxidoreductase